MRLNHLAQLLEDDRCRASLNALTQKQRVAVLETEWRVVTTPSGVFPAYAISETGQVLSLPRYRSTGAPANLDTRSRRFLPARLMRPGTHTDGYRTLTLRKNGRQYSYYLHQLVAWAFLGPQPPGHQIRHIDGNRANNHRTNLRYEPIRNQTISNDVPSNTEEDSYHMLVQEIKMLSLGALNGETDPLSAHLRILQLLS